MHSGSLAFPWNFCFLKVCEDILFEIDEHTFLNAVKLQTTYTMTSVVRVFLKLDLTKWTNSIDLIRLSCTKIMSRNITAYYHLSKYSHRHVIGHYYFNGLFTLMILLMSH